jgi:hypothetical protein
MPDLKHDDRSFLILDVVYDAIVPDANSPAFASPELEATLRSRSLGQLANCKFHFFVSSLGQRRKLTLSPRQY